MAKPSVPTEANIPTSQATAERRHGEGRENRPVDRSQRPGRDAGERHTEKPQATLEQTSKTAILRTCMDTITECFDYCIKHGGEHVKASHLRAHLDAWDLLNATCTLVARGSDFADGAKGICADAVKRCEESCERFGDDQMMKACADVCREAYEHLTS